jgi:hypothetical protein
MPLQTQDVEMFLNNARVHLTGASDAGIKLELFNTIKVFLKDSNSWLEHIRVPVTAGTQEYLVTPRNGGQIIRIEAIRDGNWFPVKAAMPNIPTLTVYQPVQMTTPPVSANDTSLGGDKPWWLLAIKNIDLPRTKEELPVAPDFVLKRYSEAILSGVLSRMMIQPQKSYSNPQLGAYHRKLFLDGIVEARQEAWTQNLFGGQRWIFPQTWRTNNQKGGSVAVWPSETF